MRRSLALPDRPFQPVVAEDSGWLSHLLMNGHLYQPLLCIHNMPASVAVDLDIKGQDSRVLGGPLDGKVKVGTQDMTRSEKHDDRKEMEKRA